MNKNCKFCILGLSLLFLIGFSTNGMAAIRPPDDGGGGTIYYGYASATRESTQTVSNNEGHLTYLDGDWDISNDGVWITRPDPALSLDKYAYATETRSASSGTICRTSAISQAAADAAAQAAANSIAQAAADAVAQAAADAELSAVSPEWDDLNGNWPAAPTPRTLIGVHGYYMWESGFASEFEGWFESGSSYFTPAIDSWYEGRHMPVYWYNADDRHQSEFNSLGNDDQIPEVSVCLKRYLLNRKADGTLGTDEIDLVGHSTGGLIIRHMIKNYYQELNDAGITINHVGLFSTPNYGCLGAFFVPHHITMDLCIDSPFLQDLQPNTHYTTPYSVSDEYKPVEPWGSTPINGMNHITYSTYFSWYWCFQGDPEHVLNTDTTVDTYRCPIKGNDVVNHGAYSNVLHESSWTKDKIVEDFYHEITREHHIPAVKYPGILPAISPQLTHLSGSTYRFGMSLLLTDGFGLATLVLNDVLYSMIPEFVFYPLSYEYTVDLVLPFYTPYKYYFIAANDGVYRSTPIFAETLTYDYPIP